MGPVDLASVTLTSPDAAATRAIGASLAAVAAPGDLICLFGDLGAGKTELAKGIGSGLGVQEAIISPSFVLMAEYENRLPLFHLDLYRLHDAAEALDDGLLDEREATGLTVVVGRPTRAGVAGVAARGLDRWRRRRPRALDLRATDEWHARYVARSGRWSRSAERSPMSAARSSLGPARSWPSIPRPVEPSSSRGRDGRATESMPGWPASDTATS
jgi:tRNA threonylcarbamoyl adenosine modification protein YjeE